MWRTYQQSLHLIARLGVALLLLLGIPAIGSAQNASETGSVAKLLAVTVDDLPAVGPRTRSAPENLRRIAAALAKEKVPATGFVVGDRGGFEALQTWVDAGLALGNHTWSHPSYSKTAIPTYLAEIRKTDRVIQEKLGIDLRKGFFRYPFLDHGNSEEKVAAVERYLREGGGRLAHVSLDTVDYRFAVVYGKPNRRELARECYLQHLQDCAEHFARLSRRLYQREIPLILLMHANELNADCMPDVIARFRAMGYRFITLDQAVSDDAYQPWLYRPPVVRGKGDRNFLNQIAMSRGIEVDDISGDAYFRKFWLPRLHEVEAEQFGK